MRAKVTSDYFDSCNYTILKKNNTNTPGIEIVYKEKNFGRGKFFSKRKTLFGSDKSVAEIMSNNLLKEYGNKDE